MEYWCSHCDAYCYAEMDGDDRGYKCCAVCGKVLGQDMYVEGPTFTKDAGGQSRLSGSILNSVQSGYSVSRERTLMKGRDEISHVVTGLGVGGGDAIINKAHVFYQIAVDKSFTKGRRTLHVAAACLYIACRQTKRAYLLIDFSDYLQINVYVLGAVFLQLCKTLHLSEHPFIQKLVDPSLFIHRFTHSLLGNKNPAVTETALRIISRMKLDWIQTGRKPGGICGAALYIAALSHGLSFSKSDIVTVVHVCEATLTKRLIEFENTESGCLTIEEFLERASEVNAESESIQCPKPGEVLCKHKDRGASHFAHGLCKKCYLKFVKISGGLQGGADPPAFQHAEKQRMLEANQEKKMVDGDIINQPSDKDLPSSNGEKCFSSVKSDHVQASTSPAAPGPDSNDLLNQKEKDGASDDGPENFSDIDDVEVDGYIHNEREKELKKIIWEEMNKEYVEEQAAKAGDEANSSVAKSRKKRSKEDKDSTPAQTPLEATRQMLKRKRFSSRINYAVLDSLYTPDQYDGKIPKMDTDADSLDEGKMKGKNQATDPRASKDYSHADGDYDGNDHSYDGNEDEGAVNDDWEF